MNYYRHSAEVTEHTSSFTFGLVAFGVAVVAIRAMQLLGLDLNSTIDTLSTAFR